MIKFINDRKGFKDSAQRLHEFEQQRRQRKRITNHQCNCMTIYFVIACAVVGWVWTLHKIGAFK